MKIFSSLFNKRFIIHFLIGMAVLILFFFSVGWFLNIFTHHGEAIAIPDLAGYTVDEARDLIENKDLEFQIFDSVYVSGKEPGTIINQYPEANHKVKEGRVVSVTVNSNEPDKIPIPELRGISVRQATADAEVSGFKIGKLTYVPDLSTTVITMSIKNKKVKAGDLFPKGTFIDLSVGRGTSKDKTTVPSVIGLTFNMAEEKLLEFYLNPGTVTYDNSVKTSKDTANAKVWKQFPRKSGDSEISLGSYIDIWLTLDNDLIPKNENDDENEDNKLDL